MTDCLLARECGRVPRNVMKAAARVVGPSFYRCTAISYRVARMRLCRNNDALHSSDNAFCVRIQHAEAAFNDKSWSMSNEHYDKMLTPAFFAVKEIFWQAYRTLPECKVSDVRGHVFK